MFWDNIYKIHFYFPLLLPHVSAYKIITLLWQFGVAFSIMVKLLVADQYSHQEHLEKLQKNTQIGTGNLARQPGLPSWERTQKEIGALR